MVGVCIVVPCDCEGRWEAREKVLVLVSSNCQPDITRREP